MFAAREHAKLKQKEAAKLIGIGQGTLSELEGSATKSAHTAKAAAVYGVSAQWLQTGDSDMLAPDASRLSPRVLFVAAMLDQIADSAAKDQACLLCETFAAMAQAGQLATVADALRRGLPVAAPSVPRLQDHTSHTAAGRPERA